MDQLQKSVMTLIAEPANELTKRKDVQELLMSNTSTLFRKELMKESGATHRKKNTQQP